MAGALRQRLEFVDIVLAELIVEKLISHTDQRLFGEYPGQQQRPGVCRGDEDRVDGKQRMDGPHYFSLKCGTAQSQGTAAHQILGAPRYRAASFHTAIILSIRGTKHPTLEGWAEC